MSEIDDYGDQYDLSTFIRRVLSVLDPVLRRRQVERHLMTVEAPVVADHLEHVLKRVATGDQECSEILLPISQFVQSATGNQQLAVEAINLEARNRHYVLLSWFLLDPPPFRAVVGKFAPRMKDVNMSLGHRISAAGAGDLRMLERLIYDYEPMVIDRLCLNPRVSEAHITTIITRRPTTPELLGVVTKHAKWISRPAIRQAILQNPYGSTGLALRLLPTLSSQFWEIAVHATHLHPSIRHFAKCLVRARRGYEPGDGVDDAEFQMPDVLSAARFEAADAEDELL